MPVISSRMEAESTRVGERSAASGEVGTACQCGCGLTGLEGMVKSSGPGVRRGACGQMKQSEPRQGTARHSESGDHRRR